MNGIVCFGEALIDFHARRVAEASDAPVFVPYPGGAPANVAVAIARLGGCAAFAGMLGADMFGDVLLGGFIEAGVDTQHLRRTAAANTALAFVSLDARGERSFSFYRPPAADLLFRNEDFDPEVFAAASIFHTGSCSMTESAVAATTFSGMRRARTAGALVSHDMNLRLALWPRDENPMPRLWEALELADLVKLSAEELAFLAARMGGEAAAIKHLWRGHARLLVVTDGSRPVRWHVRDGSGDVPCFPIDVVDSTGAGDAFVGGMLQCLASQSVDAVALDALAHDEQRRDAMLRFAAACGALAATRIGSFAAMPSRDEVERFLEMHR